MPSPRVDWQYVLSEAAEIVRSYDTGVTLRQLFYRLVSRELIPNKQTAYNSLSSRTAKARREGWFPTLVDRGREIHLYQTFAGVPEALDWLSRIYRINRTQGQDYQIWIAVEKNGLLNLLINWFGNFGVPVIALGGYSSQTFCDEISEAVYDDGRPAIFIYGGDFDPSGEDILRDFLSRTECWSATHKVALLPEHIEEYDLPPLPGKASDSQAQGFIDRHGELVQVELDALPPDALQSLYMNQFYEYWDDDAYETAIAKERRERQTLRNFIADVEVEHEMEEEEGGDSE